MAKQQFIQLPITDQSRVLSLAQLYFEHFPDEVFDLMRIAVDESPPEGGLLFRPELWKSYNWSWFAKMCGIPEEAYLHTPLPPPATREKPEPVLFAVMVILAFVLLIYYFYIQTLF